MSAMHHDTSLDLKVVANNLKDVLEVYFDLLNLNSFSAIIIFLPGFLVFPSHPYWNFPSFSSWIFVDVFGITFKFRYGYF